MWSYQGPGVIQPDPVETIKITWDGTNWVKKELK